MKRCVLYTRVSTQAQADEGTSLETQVEACRRYAEAHGLVVVRTIAEDVSGTLLARPGLDEARALAAEGAIEAVVCYSTDRLSRELVDLLLIRRELEQRRVSLHFVTMPRDESPLGVAMLQLSGIFAEIERKQILERFRRGKAARARQGYIIATGIAPFGYVRDGEKSKGQYRVHEEEAAIVRRMFHWLVYDRLSTHEIARRLREMHVPTKRGGIWQPGTVRQMLGNEVYMGVAYWNRREAVYPRRPRKHKRGDKRYSHRARDRSEWIAIPVPAVVDERLFQLAQEQLARNARSAPRSRKHDYLLNHMVVCTLCGSHYRPCFPRGNTIYYRCGRKEKSHYILPERRCASIIYRADDLEPAVWGAVTEYLLAYQRGEIETALQEYLRPEMEHAHARAELRSIEGQLEALAREEGRIVAAYREEVIDLDALRSQLDAIKRRRTAAQDLAAQLRAGVAERQKIDYTKEEIQRAVDDLPLAQSGDTAIRHEFLMALRLTVRAGTTELEITGNFPHTLYVTLHNLRDRRRKSA